VFWVKYQKILALEIRGFVVSSSWLGNEMKFVEWRTTWRFKSAWLGQRNEFRWTLVRLSGEIHFVHNPGEI